MSELLSSITAMPRALGLIMNMLEVLIESRLRINDLTSLPFFDYNESAFITLVS